MNSENHNPRIVQIERYLMGEMQAEELKTFKQRLAQDPELQNEVQQYSQLIEQLDRLRLRKKVEQAVLNSGQDPKIYFGFPIKTWLIAASLLLCSAVFVYRLFLMPAPAPVAANHLPQQQKSADTNANLEWTEGDDTGCNTEIKELPNADRNNIAETKANKTAIPELTKSKDPKPTETVNQKIETVQNRTQPQQDPPPTKQIAGNLHTDEDAPIMNIRAMPDDEKSKLLNDFYQYPKNMASLNNWKETYKEYAQTHATTLQTDTVLMLIAQLYKQQKSSRYLLKLNNLSKADPNNFAIKYYLAHSYLTASEPEKALPLLDDICNAAATFSFTPDAQWNQALCYTFTSPHKAKELLTNLSQNLKHPYSAQAHRLLGRLYAPENK
ncbi:hypothetical protein C7N43_27270 [Sphingobacteriales bacterium UPWRP_1]|nr:hypothetical protein C7N43_27270 [Sphingobacteriales bacterium UPWRP_1]